jgi:hypothetical protein
MSAPIASLALRCKNSDPRSRVFTPTLAALTYAELEARRLQATLEAITAATAGPPPVSVRRGISASGLPPLSPKVFAGLFNDTVSILGPNSVRW